MNKKFIILPVGLPTGFKTYDSQEAAEKEAKKHTARTTQDTEVFQLVALTEIDPQNVSVSR